MYIKRISSIALMCLTFGSTYAQRYMGLATGSYDAINALYLNPASISGCNEKIVVNLFSLNVALDNSLGTFSKLSNIGSSNGDAFKFSGDQPFSMVVPALDLRLPAIMISLNDKLKQSFALNFRIRGMNQFNHFDPTLYRTVTSSDHIDQDYHFTTNNFNWTAHVWSEIGLSYALQVLDNGPHKIKAGITLRYLGGVDYLSLKGKNLDVTYKQGNDTFYAQHSDLEFASNAISADNAFKNGVDASGIFSSLFGAKAGSGFGMDLGVTYTYNIGSGDDIGPPQLMQKPEGHRLTASVAITDIGSIKYKEGKNFVVNVSGDGHLTGKELSDKVSNYTEFKNYIASKGFQADTGSKATKVYMPTSLIIGADYQIWKKFYVNATYIANLANRQNVGNSYYNQLTITPRFDYKLITMGLPITYSSLAKDIKVGIGFRISGFFFGSDDMLALINDNQHGFGFFFGFYVPIFRKASKGDYY